MPGDNDDEVAARGILYLLIFQQLGQLVRWSWGYHVLLAPAESYEDHSDDGAIEQGRYRDDPSEELTREQLIPGLDGEEDEEIYRRGNGPNGKKNGSSTANSFESGGRTPVTTINYAGSIDSDDEEEQIQGPVPYEFLPTPANGRAFPSDRSNGNITSFPRIRTPTLAEEYNISPGIKGWIPMVCLHTKRSVSAASQTIEMTSQRAFYALPRTIQHIISTIGSALARFLSGAWEFMNPPLWAMLIAVIVASIPKLQRLFFEEGSFIANSVTRAVSQSGGVAVPLILVVLGANLARNTLPKEAYDVNSEENQIGTKLLVASLISRMLLPTIIMAPLLALAAKYVPVSILDDPIFVIVCFLLTGAPSALQLAQICQINGVYEDVMSKLLFQSYVIWYVVYSFPVLV